MRRDAQFHPEPELFDKWANGGKCPYSNCAVEQAYHFDINKRIWKSGKPTMSDYELLLKIMKEKNW